MNRIKTVFALLTEEGYSDYSILTNAQYNTTEAFKPYTKYIFSIKLSLYSAKPYYFTSDTKYYINGKEADVEYTDIGQAFFGYTYYLTYDNLVFTDESDFNVGGTIYIYEKASDYILDDMANTNDDAMMEMMEDNYSYNWYADGELVQSGKETTYKVPYERSCKKIYAEVTLAGLSRTSLVYDIPVFHYKGDIDHDGFTTEKDAAYLLKGTSKKCY
ncbi:MAG: hypothetical protein IJS61_07940 [Firmicutes bacterium]|nr:hypothetical protein [Bacillota bacterium]